MLREFRMGVDLGGTKIEAAVLDRAGAIVWSRRVATPAGEYAATVEAIARLVEEGERDVGGGATVGIATPGARSLATGLIRNANSTCLNGRPLKEDIEKRLAREVRMANDANCFALSEAIDGAGRGADVVFGVILGTGVGGGIVVQRRILEGANSIGGEWGHNALPLPGPGDHPLPLCYCGRRGCVETYLSGPGLARDFARENGERPGADEIARRAQAGDAACAAAIERYVERLARALACVINVLDPEVIVLGGGLSGIQSLYRRVPALWKQFVFSDEVRTKLVPPLHGDASGVRGAAWLWDIPIEAPRRDARVTLREVDDSNIDLVAALRVGPMQIFDVASVGKTFWQLGKRADAWVRAIYGGEIPVGLVVLIDKGAERYLARLLVDASYQGRGFGAQALRLALEHARAEPGCTGVRLSHMPGNARVGGYYERFGFRHTGVVDEDGELEMRLDF